MKQRLPKDGGTQVANSQEQIPKYYLLERERQQTVQRIENPSSFEVRFKEKIIGLL